MGPPARRALLLALCAAVLALAASVIAAAGPARGESAEYTWPPETLPARSPTDGWYAPLPLLNRVPSSIEVQLACALAPALRSGRPVTVLATARRPRAAGALRVVLVGDSLRIGVGSPELASVPWPASCPLHVDVRDGELRLPTRTARLETGTPDGMPIVTGLFTGLDLRSGEPPQVVIRTREYATSPTARQAVAATLAVVLACVALLLLARPHRRFRPFRLRCRIGSAWRARDRTDAVVVSVLLVWWIVAPTFSDDGWLWVEHRVLADSGLDSIYFNNWGLSFPFGYWPIWLGHWAIGSTNDLVFARLPSLVAVLASWPLCRWCLHSVLGGRATSIVRWTLAGSFLVGATGWLMTLRPEPYIALLALASLAAMVSFVRAPSLVPLAIAVPAAVLAATAHPVGIVASAPLFAGAPHVVRWLWAGRRPLLIALTALLLSGLALALVLLTVDADLATRLGDARLVGGEDLHGEPWWREYVRYTRFDQDGGETAVRRLSLALLLLSVVAWLTRRRTSQPGVLLVPARSVAIGLLLLAFLPSKWPWHFGALFAVGAVATAAEAARLIHEQVQPGSRLVRPLLAVAVVGLAVLGSWNAVGNWSPLDLQEARWSFGFGIRGRSWWVGLVFVLAALATLVWCVSRARWVADRLALVVAGIVAVVTLAAVSVAAAILAYDAAISSWSPARQNVEALVGGGSCGLAHQLRGEAGLVERIADPATATLIVPNVGLYFPCATIPAIDGGLVEIPRLVISPGDPWPLYTSHGPFAAVPDLYALRSIAQGPRGVEVLSVADDVPGFVRADAVRRDLRER